MKNLRTFFSVLLSVALLISIGVNVALFLDSTQIHQEIHALRSNNSPILPSQTIVVEESSIIEAVQKVRPSVVSIIQTKELSLSRQRGSVSPFFNDPFFEEFFPELEPQQIPENEGESGSQRIKTGGGSGFISSPEGLVMTNRHVVADENAEYTVVLYDGTELPATVLARDSFNDVAVLQIALPEDDRPELTPVVFGDSESLQVGQKVVAIGNALAEFQNTVTTGIISGIGRDITAGGRSLVQREQLSNLLQTDAAINPGNSGGPLVNLQGQVVGMNTAIASGAQGIGFAIPSADLVNIAESVAENGRIVRPYLGVQYMMLTPEVATEFDLEITEGALLIGGGETQRTFAVLKNSPAEKAGLQEKDVITDIDGEPVTQKNDLRSIIARKSAGDSIILTFWRDGVTQEQEVMLKEAP